MNWISVFPDMLLLATGLAVLCVDAVSRNEEGHQSGIVALLGTLAVLAALVCTRSHSIGGWPTYAVTPIGFWWRLVFTLTLLAVQIYSQPFFQGAEAGRVRSALTRPGAFHSLLLFCTAGMFTIVSSRDLLTFFLGLELATLPLFALVGFQSRSSASVEAASKLMILAGMATALNLFGLSLVYGATGGLGFDRIALAAAQPVPLLGLGALFLFGGIGFKVAVFPFQMWAPDVYDGAPTPVTAFLAVGSKAAGLAALSMLFFGPLRALRPDFYPVFFLAAVASMWIGSFGAMRQTHMRRFIAFSSISQAGYFLLAFTGTTGEDASGEMAVLYNLLVYGAANLALFFILSALGPKRSETLSSFRGLSLERPGLAILLVMSLFSLAGIPPMAGFLGKFQLFSVAFSAQHYVLVSLGLANAVFSLFYYLQPVKEAYVSSAESLSPIPKGAFQQIAMRWILGASLILLVLAMRTTP